MNFVFSFHEVVNGKQMLSSCSRYRPDVVRNLSDWGLVPGRDVNLTDLEQEICLDGWNYSKDIYHSTIVSEVCVYVFLGMCPCAGTLQQLRTINRVLFHSGITFY